MVSEDGCEYGWGACLPILFNKNNCVDHTLADAVEALGEDMEEKAANELMGVEFHGLPAIGAIEPIVLQRKATPPSSAAIGTWRSSSATQQGSSVVEGAADQKTMLDHGSPQVCN